MNEPQTDTSPEVEEMLLERLRRMSPRDKVAMIADLTETVRQLALARIRRQYGNTLTERDQRLRLAALHLDREILIAAFGWDPAVEGY
jgi:hypothetical protein